MKDSTKTKLKIYCQKESRVRSLISFGKITSALEAFNELSLSPLTTELQRIKDALPETITTANFKYISETIKEILLVQWEKPKIKENKEDVCKSIELLYNVEDILLESTEYLGRVDLKSAHERKIEWLETFIPLRDIKQSANCLYFQKEWALETFYDITQRNFLAKMLRANTGDGKTYAAGQLIRWLLDSKYLESFSISPWKVLFVTGASIVNQTREVLEDDFGLDCNTTVQIVNYESLRSSFGLERFLTRKIIVQGGEEHEVWEWNKLVHPPLIIWDECHKLKNENSIQSKVAQATNNLDYLWPFGDLKQKAKIIQVFMSASPFSRVFHAKAFACACRHTMGSRLVTNKNWRDVANSIVAPADLNEYSKVAIKRFLKEFKPYIGTFKNVRRKHRAIHSVEYLNLRNDADRKKYQLLWETYLERKKQVEGMDYGNSRFLLLVELLVFRMGASLLKHWDVTQKLVESHNKGFAPVFMTPFKATIAKVVLNLVNDFNISREKISIIWGGNQAFAGAKTKFSPEQVRDILTRAMKEPGSVSIKTIKSIHAQFQAEQEGLGNIDANLRLGTQTKEMRDIERKRFQSGKSEICLATFGAGKEGLSLHQNEDYLRPRRQFNDTTYNEMEMLQAEGRTARITSKSDTEITTLAYRDTIEVAVLRRVMAKKECLNIVTSHGTTIDETYSKELNKILELVGLETAPEEDEELEEGVFEQLENESEL